MRITSQMSVDNAIYHMGDNLERLNALNEKIASGKQFQTMSDDPARAASALSLRSTLQANQNYIDNDQVVGDWLSANELAFKQIVDVGTRATVLGQQGISDTMSLQERSALANEIDELLTDSVNIANSQHMGKYIFAGLTSRTQPFTLNAARSAVTASNDPHSIQVDISPGQTLTTNFNGQMVFQGMFNGLIQLRDALLSNDSTAIQTAVAVLQDSMDPINSARTTNGARQRQLKLTMDTMDKTRTQIKSLLSDKEDVNMAEAISMLNNQETSYQAVIQVSSRAMNLPSLFDTMR